LADELKGRIELENPSGLVARTSLVNEAVETYLKNRMDDGRNGVGRANPRSVKIYRSVAENWIKPILGELQVRHLTPGRLDTYFRNDVPPTRYADVRKILHAFINWLTSRERFAATPSSACRATSGRPSRSVPRIGSSPPRT